MGSYLVGPLCAVGGNLVQNGNFLLPALAPSWMASLNGTHAGAQAFQRSGEDSSNEQSLAAGLQHSCLGFLSRAEQHIFHMPVTRAYSAICGEKQTPSAALIVLPRTTLCCRMVLMVTCAYHGCSTFLHPLVGGRADLQTQVDVLHTLTQLVGVSISVMLSR
jgi:hypothetical protein